MSGFIQELINTGLYKRNQGRITRQVTFAAIAITVGLGLWRLSEALKDWKWIQDRMPGCEFWLPGVLLLGGLWIAYRVVNVPAFADFLIAVEAEMNKVSWPSRAELFRASMVVLITIFALAFILFTFDWLWRWFFTILKIFPKKEAVEAAMAGFDLDWRVLFSIVPRVF